VNRRNTTRSGFTLVELMIGSSIGAVVMVALFSAFTFVGRNLARLSSYQALENESRKVINHLARDFNLGAGVKPGTNPTASAVTLLLPGGEVSYTFDSVARSVRRQATFGPSPDLTFFSSQTGECSAFELRYFTTSGGAPSDQTSPATNVPFSIKQIQVRLVAESPMLWATRNRTRYEAATARFYLRNRTAPDGT
jgi:prepilin-type N-terminal cleavage/methylation domain-containing protein